ncbi:hypothetical protein [Methylobacterium mesophilicum]|uniref:hypothetical protein n=1 Tax=Methylobacterium mesophilicum TaxID=39956 RepID=UPI0002C60679|nr:hypothetical protein [Methylobacterium mesophilicum]
MPLRQRQATVAMCDAVLACQACTPDLRRRAERLRARVSGDCSRVSFGTLVIVVI